MTQITTNIFVSEKKYFSIKIILYLLCFSDKLTGTMSAPDVTQEMMISNDVAGSVIGKSGSKVTHSF